MESIVGLMDSESIVVELSSHRQPSIDRDSRLRYIIIGTLEEEIEKTVSACRCYFDPSTIRVPLNARDLVEFISSSCNQTSIGNVHMLCNQSLISDMSF